MKRLSIIVLTLAAALSSLSGAAQSRYHSVFQLTLVTPVGTNGSRAHLYTNDVSVNILAGVSASERAVALAGLANIVTGDVRGFQAAGLGTFVGGDGRGAMSSGLAGIVAGDYTGAQFSGGFNFTRDLERGAQFAGAFNFARDLERGAQFAGAFNFARRADRVAQFAGAVNIARDLEGLQVAGAVNVARDVDGLQIAGAVNIARNVRGTQIGVVNIARNSDNPVGLVNIIGNGEMGVGVGYNEIGTWSVNFRSGGRALYGIVGMGLNHQMRDWYPRPFSIIGGLGAHINITPWLRINNEITSESYVNLGRIMIVYAPGYGDHGGPGALNGKRNTGIHKVGYALMPAFRLGRVEVFGGPSINYLQSGSDDLWSGGTLWKKDTVRGYRWTHRQIFIGWQVGAQFLIKTRSER